MAAWVWVVVLGVAALALAVPNSPAVTPIPGRDSGVFLYVADHVLQGGMPYRDVWDHKPPLIYLIDALGLWLGGGSRWGVWALEVAALWSSAVLGWALLRRTCGRWLAGGVSLAWLLAAVLLLPRGNFTEEYALPLQFAVFALAAGGVEGHHSARRWAAVGAAGTGLALLRPDLAAVAAAAGGWLLCQAIVRLRQGPGSAAQGFRCVGGMILGALLPLAAVVAWLAWGHALADAWDQVVRYNGIYARATWPDRWQALREGWRDLAPSGLMVVGVGGWLAGLWWALAAARRRRPATLVAPPWLPLALLALPLQLGLAAVSGRAYRHYYLAWLPMLALLAGLALAWAVARLPRRWPPAWRVALPAAVLIAMAARPGLTLVEKAAPATQTDDTVTQVVAYVQAHTAPGEAVLMWGAEAAVNYAAERPAPTRYVYQYPLYTAGYADAAMWARFQTELAATPPALIIDSSPGNEDVPPIAAEARRSWKADLGDYYVPAELDGVCAAIETGYQPVATLGEEGWVVYARRP